MRGSTPTPIDVESLVQAVPGSSPCGSDLEYDAEFLDLDRLVQGKPEQQMGSAVVPAQEPTWDAVRERALCLLHKTKDLRVALALLRALLVTDGFTGLRDGLAVLRGLVERHWDNLFPRLDRDDGNDPTRVNVLMGLCDPAAVIERVRALPLLTSRSFGRFGLRDLAVAAGESPPAPGAKPLATSTVDGAFAEIPLADLQATAGSVHASLGHLAALEAALGAHLGEAKAPSFATLSRLLAQAEKLLAARLAQRSPALPTGDPTGAAAAGEISVAAAQPGMVASRDDVVRLVDRICEYYRQHEPSSPIPLLLQRCKRLVSASFLEIIRDVAPGALPQVEILRGKDS